MKRQGLTLIEILVSTLILALVLAGLVNVFTSSRNYIVHYRKLSISSELGKNFLNPLEMDINQSTWGSNCLSAGINCPSDVTIDGTNYRPEYEFMDFGNELRKVKLTIHWNETR